MAEHDLTARMGSFLDRHLVFPLLEFLSVKEVSFNLYRLFIDSLTFMWSYQEIAVYFSK